MSDQQSGTVKKFEAPQGSETEILGSEQSNVQTQYQCITAMDEYAGKSLEELRMEDYEANRGHSLPVEASHSGSIDINLDSASTSAIGQGNSARLNGDQRKTTIYRFGTAEPFGSLAATSSNALLWHNELSPLGFPDYNPMLAQLARVSDVEQDNVSSHRPTARRRSRRERRNSEGRRRQRRRHRHRHRRTYRQASSDNPLLQIGTPDDSRTQVSLSIRFAEDSVFNRFLQWVMEQ